MVGCMCDDWTWRDTRRGRGEKYAVLSVREVQTSESKGSRYSVEILRASISMGEWG
jgi:hypothetical protein